MSKASAKRSEQKGVSKSMSGLTESGAVQPCDKAKKKVPKPAITAAQLNKNMADCPEAKQLSEKASKATGKNASVGVKTKKEMGDNAAFGGQAETTAGVAVVNSDHEDNQTMCGAMDTAVFETVNLSATKAFDWIADQADQGKLSREAYTRAYEKVEYDNIQKQLAVLSACKKKWGCGKFSPPLESWKGTSFESYFKSASTKKHHDVYRDYWDKNYGDTWKSHHAGSKSK